MQAGAEKFRLKSQWRETGYSPIGLVFDRIESTPQTFPFTTWKISADWMEKDTYIEVMTPKEMPKAVSLSISSKPIGERETETANQTIAMDPIKGAMFHHPNGSRRLTSVKVTAPSADGFPPSANYVARYGLAKFEVGGQWILDVTLDNGKQGISRDLRPALPLVIHY